jgi:hypothetical protein
VVFSFTLDTRSVVLLLVSGLTASGADWLLRSHPELKGQSTLQHWILPALTAWVVGGVLFTLPYTPAWFVGFAFGGALIMVVLVAEYIVVDPHDVRQPVAAAALIAMSFALFLALAITLHIAGLRLFLRFPLVGGAALLVSLRALYLRLQGRWLFFPALAVALITGQLSTALHYWPISSVAYGLALLAPLYALNSAIAAMARREPIRHILLEPALVAGLIWLAALLAR